MKLLYVPYVVKKWKQSKSPLVLLFEMRGYSKKPIVFSSNSDICKKLMVINSYSLEQAEKMLKDFAQCDVSIVDII